MTVEYEKEFAITVLKLKPTNETEYKLAEQKAKIEHADLRKQILEKQNFIKTLEQNLKHTDETLNEFNKFEQEMDETLNNLLKILGE